MATKLKNNKWFILIVSFFVLVGLAVGMVSTYPSIEKSVSERGSFFEDSFFYEQIKWKIYSTYVEVLEERHEDSLSIVENLYDIPTTNLGKVYQQLLEKYYDTYGYPEILEEDVQIIEEDYIFNSSASVSQESIPVEVDQIIKFAQLSQEEQLATIKQLLVKLMKFDIDELKSYNDLENLHYFALDEITNKTYSYEGYSTKPLSDLFLLIDAKEGILEKYKEDYQYFIVLSYDSEGNLTISKLYGADLTEVEVSKMLEMKELLLVSNQDLLLKSPTNMTFVYAVPKNLLVHDSIYWNMRNSIYFSVYDFGIVYEGIAVILLLGFSLLVPLTAISKMKVMNHLFKWPIEIMVSIAFGLLAVYLDSMIELICQTFLNPQTSIKISDTLSFNATSLCNIFAWFILFLVTFIVLLYFKNLFKQGWTQTLTKNCWLYQGGRFLFTRGKSMILRLKQFLMGDLKEKATQKLLVLIGIQAIIISVFCLGWFFGIIAVLIYSVVLFIFLRNYLSRIKIHYAKLVKLTEELAEGNLDVELNQDLGIFNAFKEEVANIQIGFKKAVEAEVRSQRMKTDLIANVSHDLKTPLTSIITYTDLLKDQTLDVNKRVEYLQTLDQKAQRLKVLIEDLFEMSKASSGNITMNIHEVDVTSLMKQTLLELEDKIQQANLTIRRQFPEHKVMLMLDGERTFRVFDNLILNITKYAMPGTRAYVDIFDTSDTVQIIFRNISADEITIEGIELTERFVRGDQSRHTEGSGLGLAIAKSFVELQGGQFEIQVDGDLFKVILTFNK
ncbi:MAG: HAMP domain-containing histidine kinase [Turicibacter sp.]|nr:HAMP domain-containing histidine kinase [Turicibacter sp.]